MNERNLASYLLGSEVVYTWGLYDLWGVAYKERVYTYNMAQNES